jgi:RNA polymerase sigma-70 factor, ECF subfamily
VTDANVPSGGGAAEPSSSLLARVRASEQAAWARLVDLYSPLVYRWCRQAGLQAADAADVGQQVFLAVARKVRDFRRDREGDSFRGWVREITRNKVSDHFRARAGAPPAEGGDALLGVAEETAAGPDASDAAADPEEEGLLYRRAVELIRAEFEPRTWQAFWQVVVDGRPPADVAGALGTTRNAVYLAKARVLRRLREEFADLMDL